MMPAYISRTSVDYLRNIHLLIVDSDQVILGLLSRVLHHLGFKNVRTALDGFEAIQSLNKEETDLIFTDWDLKPADEFKHLDIPPNPIVRSELWSPVAPIDGASFVKYIRMSKHSPNPYIPIIMLTGAGLQNHIEYARNAGVNEIILKPLVMESLCARIAAVIDAPRAFVTSSTYKGPCRRRYISPIHEKNERRKRDVIVISHMK